MRARAASSGSPLLTALALGLLLAACGGGGGAASDEETEISKTIAESVESHDPSKCTELLTLNFVEQNSDSSGRAAVEECEEEAPDESDDPKEVTVSKIGVDGSNATAAVAFVGGSLDKQTVDVALVKEGDQWKLDEIADFAVLDKGALANTFEEAIEKVGGEIPPEQLKCIGDKIRNVSDSEAEELLLGGSSQPLVELAESCE